MMETRSTRQSMPENDKSLNRDSRPSVGTKVCVYWLAGRCTRNPCRFAHPESAPNSRSRVWTRDPNLNNGPQNTSVLVSAGDSIEDLSQKQKPSPHKICHYWAQGNCKKGDRCTYLHSWFYGEGITMLTKLDGHTKPVSGIELPLGSEKLFVCGKDGILSLWDCHSGQCANTINLGDEIGSLISEGNWIFVGMPNAVKACNFQTGSEFSLAGPVGQVYAMAVGNLTLFAGDQNGAIFTWRGGNSESTPFKLAGCLKGHTRPVVNLTVGGNLLYSASMDDTIMVWDLQSLECVQTLIGHSDVVMSLLCWDQFLLSCSLDGTIKVWAAKQGGGLEVTYTHEEDYGIIALLGLNDAEGNPLLLCSLNDNSIRMYELPSFMERGRIFSKEEVRVLQTAPGGLFFAGEATGQITVWRLMSKA